MAATYLLGEVSRSLVPLSNNKGWKERFIFVRSSLDRDFSLSWSGRSIDNILPFLLDEEAS